jgi:hypothetical protein
MALILLQERKGQVDAGLAIQEAPAEAPGQLPGHHEGQDHRTSAALLWFLLTSAGLVA